MKRTDLNLFIDALALAAVVLLVSTGLLIEFRLPPGSGGGGLRGHGFGAANRPVETIWGWTRHEWGEVHFSIACVMILIVVVHLILHWKWIVGVLKNKTDHFSHGKTALFIALLVIGFCVAALPLLVSKKSTTLRQRQMLDVPAESFPTSTTQSSTYEGR
jgi:hypothetical protein